MKYTENGYKIASKDGLSIINKSTWTKTILDVRTENAEVYCADVLQNCPCPTMNRRATPTKSAQAD